MKGASHRNHAVEPHAPAHHIGELQRNREAQARSAETPRHGTVHLPESFEDNLLAILGDARPGIAHGEMQGDCSVGIHITVCGVIGLLYANVDFTRLREFDGVTDKVDDDLSKTVWISYQRIGHVWRNTAIEVETFLGGAGCQTP